MRTLAALFVFLALVLPGATQTLVATGYVEPGEWRFGGGVAAEPSVGSKLHGATMTTPICFTGAMQSGCMNIAGQSYDDAFGTPVAVRAEAAYGLSNNDEVFGSIGYVTANGRSQVVGTASLRGSTERAPLIASYSDYQSTGIEVGYRKYFDVASRAAPYVAVRGGAAVVEGLRLDLSAPAVGLTPRRAQLYERTTVPTAAIDVGFVYPVSPNFEIGAETGVRYTGAPNGANRQGLNELGVRRLNDKGERYSIPIMLRGTLKF